MINFEPLKHFRVEFKNYAPVSGKPLSADLLFDNRAVASFPSLDKKLTYHHQNYNLQSSAYDYNGFLHQVLVELNDQVFNVIPNVNDQKINELYRYLLTDNRFNINMTLCDLSIAKRVGARNVPLPVLIQDALKSFNSK
jgi:hypothetical protein